MTQAVARVDATCTFCGTTKDVEAHHFREDNPSQGKGMGGAYADLDTIDLCHEHHQGDRMGLHKKRWQLYVADTLATGFAPDGNILFDRPLALDDSSADPVDWTPEHLADALFEIEREKLLEQGRICAVFWERSRWYDDWPQAASDAIGNATGRHIGARTIRRLANLWLYFKEDPELVAMLGKSVAYLVAESSDPAPILAEAKRLREGGANTRETLAELRDTVVNERERHTCACGDEHYRKEAQDAKATTEEAG